MSCNFMPCILIGPSYSRPAISCLAKPRKLVRQFHVLQFHAPHIGPFISCPAFSCPAILMVCHFHVLHFQSTQIDTKWQGTMIAKYLSFLRHCIWPLNWLTYLVRSSLQTLWRSQKIVECLAALILTPSTTFRTSDLDVLAIWQSYGHFFSFWCVVVLSVSRRINRRPKNRLSRRWFC